MPPEIAEIRQWVRKADQDRRMAAAGLAQTPPITDGAAFHCQQAVEKLLKAFLIARQIGFERIRDLDLLVDACSDSDAAFGELRAKVTPLTAYAVRFRYPGLADPSVEQVQTALAIVNVVWDFVLERLPGEVAP